MCGWGGWGGGGGGGGEGRAVCSCSVPALSRCGRAVARLLRCLACPGLPPIPPPSSCRWVASSLHAIPPTVHHLLPLSSHTSLPPLPACPLRWRAPSTSRSSSPRLTPSKRRCVGSTHAGGGNSWPESLPFAPRVCVCATSTAALPALSLHRVWRGAAPVLPSRQQQPSSVHIHPRPCSYHPPTHTHAPLAPHPAVR